MDVDRGANTQQVYEHLSDLTLLVIAFSCALLDRRALTAQCVPRYDRKQDGAAQRTPEVPLHAPLAWIEGILQGLNEVMAQAEVECQRHCLEECKAQAV